MSDRQHMDAAQDFLVEDGGLAALDGILVRFARLRTPLCAYTP